MVEVQRERYAARRARLRPALEAAGFAPGTEVAAFVRDDGTHSEGFWRREFPAAYRWLFAEDDPCRAPAGGAPDRRGARAGDALWVTGTIGEAGLGLALARAGAALISPLAGYLGGWVDTVVMRIVDILLSIPSLLLAVT